MNTIAKGLAAVLLVLSGNAASIRAADLPAMKAADVSQLGMPGVPVPVLMKLAAKDAETADTELGTKLLFQAIKANNNEMLKMLLANPKIDINQSLRVELNWGAQTFSPLGYAIHLGFYSTVGILLERSDLQVNATNAYGYTELMKAVLSGQVQMVGLLLQRSDIQINAKNERGETALSLAAKGTSDISAALLANGAQF